MSVNRYTTPATLDAMKGKWGFAYDDKCCCSLSELLDVCIVNLQNGDILIYNEVEGCWENGPVPPGAPICMPDLCDVCYDPPAVNPIDGQFLVYLGPPDDCWQNKDVEVCEDVVAGAFEYKRSAEIYDLPGPITVVVTKYNQYSAGMSVANSTHTIFVNSSLLLAGANIDIDLATNNGDISGTNTTQANWVAWNNTFVPPFVSPTLETPEIEIPANTCGRVAIHHLSYAKLLSEKIDNGSLGVFFRLINVADATDIHYFTSLSQRTTPPYAVSPLLPNYQPYAWEITEVGSHSYGDNTLPIAADAAIRTYRMEVYFYISPRYIDHTVSPVQNGLVVDPFEIEPYFFLTFEKDNINVV